MPKHHSCEKALEFLKVSSQFKLGDLSTEKFHPNTRELSRTVQSNLCEAINLLKQIDINALTVLEKKLPELCLMHSQVKKTIREGNRIFLAGCGSTGRLCITLEFLWRRLRKEKHLKEKVIGFMAGGDAAMIRSIENFEDHPEFGSRQLIELGFSEGDLLIGCTEGGETPYVIGAVEAALSLSGKKPFFIYGNPDEILCKSALRSKRIISNPMISKINLDGGPMAIAGSTRMQSSTIIMAAVGMALQYIDVPFSRVRTEISKLRKSYDQMDIEILEPFIRYESSVYLKSEHILYQTNKDLAITLLTDATERSPTFSVPPFENTGDITKVLSTCYLYLPSAETADSAWRLLLNRTPRTLDWPDNGKQTGIDRLLGYDFSNCLSKRRLKGDLAKKHHIFKISGHRGGLNFELESLNAFIKTENDGPLQKHLFLKMMINTHSTLVMGFLKRYHGNLMTWVNPTNNKLKDRAARYLQILAKEQGIRLSYSQAVKEIFRSIHISGSFKNPVIVRALNRVVRNNP